MGPIIAEAEAMTGKLAGKVALVTGSGRSLGRAIAMRFAAEGARVAILDIEQASIDKTVADIQAAGGAATGFHFDVREIDRIEAIVAEVVAALGPIDILVNNAWDQGTAHGRVLEITTEQLRRQLDSGPVSYLRFMQAVFPYMDGRDGRIINLASCLGLSCMETFGPYAMTKEAIRALTRTAAREWGPRRVTVNNLLPVAATDAFRQSMERRSTDELPPCPVPRIGDPADDIAPMALFLASAEASYFTGYSFCADGGLSMDAAR
jgi:NAD(P)-dependent dehydrogenase (short-subunit alcohol dehydrogenase family)